MSKEPVTRAMRVNTPNDRYILTRTRKNRAVDARTISSIARLCAKGLTETEAALRLGIRPGQWFTFKSGQGRSEKFAELLDEFRAGRIELLIERIEKSADGEGMKQPDWRAAAHLLAIADARRFSASAQAPAPQIATPVNVQLAISVAMKAYEAASGVITAPVETKALPAPSNALPAMFPKEQP